MSLCPYWHYCGLLEGTTFLGDAGLTIIKCIASAKKYDLVELLIIDFFISIMKYQQQVSDVKMASSHHP